MNIATIYLTDDPSFNRKAIATEVPIDIIAYYGGFSLLFYC